MKTLAIILSIVLVLPFYVYFLSKLQMLGWIAALKFNIINLKKESQDGQTYEEK